MAENIVEIKIKDKQNWESFTGIATDWTTYSKKYKEGRVQPNFLSPVVSEDTWNGSSFDAQHIIWDAWYFQPMTKESELKFFQHMKSTYDIEIIEYSDNNGTVINKTYIPDTKKSEYINISEPERAADTTGWKFDIIFRTNRTIINKALPVYFTNRLVLNKSSEWGLSFEATIPGSIAFLDEFNLVSLNSGVLQKYKRVLDTWVVDGDSLFLLGIGSNPAITGLSSNSVAVVGDGLGYLSKYEFSLNTWSLVGNTLTLPGTYNAPTVSSLTSSRVAIFDDLYGNLAAYDFDGTDWTLVGNLFPLVTVGNASLVSMTSSKIAFLNPSTGDLSDYDFDGTNWTINQTINSGNAGVVARLSDTIVAVFDLTSDLLLSFELNGTWSQRGGSGSVSGTSFASMVGLNENELYLNASTSGVYSYGKETYFSDYDVIDWVELTEPVLLNWKGDNDTIIQSISKIGYEIVLYMSSIDYSSFDSDFKGALDATINGTLVEDLKYEPSLIGEDLYKVIVRGVSTKTIINKADPVDNTYSLVMNSNTYYTDFTIDVSEKTVDNVVVDWFDGTQKLFQSTYKKTWSMVFFINDGSLDNIQEDFRISQIKTINGQSTQEAEMTTERVAETYNKVIITGVIQSTPVNHDTSPLNSYNLVVNSNTYYTDYVPKLVSEEGEIDPINNQTGINKTSKAIAKNVKQLRFFLNEADAFQLQEDFILDGEGAVLNPGATSVLENRQVSITELGTSSGLYEVVVNCLIGVTIN